MPKTVPIPPKGQLLSAHSIQRAAFGWDLTVKLQSLDLTKDLTESEIVAIAFVQLGGWMQERGIDVDALTRMIRGG